MTIIYSLVANGSTVLAEYSPNTGNFMDIARQLLREIPLHKHRKSYAAQNTIFHYMVDDGGLIFLCMADADSGHRIPFSFLEDIRSRFTSQFGRAGYQTATENSLDDAFSRTLQQQMHFFNTDKEADQIRRVRGEIDAVKEVMVQNIDKVLERGEKIEVLVDQTNKLQSKSYTFKKKSTTLKRQLWWKNVYLCGCIIACIVIIVAVILLIILWKLGVFKK
ncbi:Vesicle-associated membrane protein 711 [Balamuthia mandrillaris]